MYKKSQKIGLNTALITGGAGFIGSNLAHELVNKEVDVTILDTMSNKYGANKANLDPIQSEVDLVIGDVRDEDIVAELVNNVDAVFHLAAQLSRPISMENPEHDLDINCRGTLTVLEAVRKENPDIPVVYTSSQAIFGKPVELPATEETPPNPVDIYGTHKLAGEQYCRVYHQAYGIGTISLRLTNVYGPRAQLDNPNYGVINKFLRLALKDETLSVYKPGTMIRDPIFVDDVVHVLVSVVERDVSGETFVIGSEQQVPIRELAKTIVETVGKGSVKLVPWPDKWASIRIGDIYVDASKARNRLDWEPQVKLISGLKQTFEYYRDRFDQYINEE